MKIFACIILCIYAFETYFALLHIGFLQVSNFNPNISCFKYQFFFSFFLSVHRRMFCLALGWLQDPDSRPTFNDLGKTFEMFLEDPFRYILTTTNGGVADYAKLPSNVLLPGESTYEDPNLVTGATMPTTISTSNGGLYGNTMTPTEYRNGEA